jgi:hypothetical protein
MRLYFHAFLCLFWASLVRAILSPFRIALVAVGGGQVPGRWETQMLLE